MALADLSQGDFKYLTSYADKMKACHEDEFMSEIDPDWIRAFYRGRKVKDKKHSRSTGMTDDEHLLMLSTVFGAANTILPNLYYRNPSPIITSIRGQAKVGGVNPEESAALLTALEKFYMKKNDGKAANQECCLNAYFFGLGWKKISYQRQLSGAEEISEEPESADRGAPSDKAGFGEMLGISQPSESSKPIPLQSGDSSEFVEDEGLLNSSESPMNVWLDHKADLRNGKARCHAVNRSLYDLMSFGSYEPSVLQEIYQKFKYSRGSRLDTRDIDLELRELHVQQRNGIWVLTWVEGFNKALQYEPAISKKFQLLPLQFSSEPGIRYPISHMKLMCQSADKLDKVASLFYQTVARSRNMMFINASKLQQGTIDAIEKNRIQGIALTKVDPGTGMFAHAQSPSVQNDLPTLMQLIQQSIIQISGADEQLVSGKSKNKTLGQDELARIGTKVRESGMQDRVKDHLIAQAEMEACLLKEYSEAELELEITGEDFADPIMAEKFEKETIKFMSPENPLPASRYIDGIDYKFDFNMEDALKPDREQVAAGIERTIAFTSNPIVEEALNNSGVEVRQDLLAKEWLTQQEYLGNPRKYLQPISPMQLAAKQARKMLMGGGGSAAKPPAPQQKQGGASMAGKQEREPQSSEAAKL